MGSMPETTQSLPLLESHALTFWVASLSLSRFRAMRSVQAYTRDALQLHRADLGEGHLDPRGGIDDLLADEDLTRPGVLGDPRGEVHRSSVVVALLEEDGPGGQAKVM